MKTKLTSFAMVIFVLCTQIIIGQGLPATIITKELNRQIFDADAQFPRYFTLTNKYHEFNYGKIKSEIIYSNDERVIREFNQEGNMVKYQVYRCDKLTDDFTYEYAEDRVSLLRERGTYNLNYFKIDSNRYVGVNALEKGVGFTYNLDTLFVYESKVKYELTQKLIPKDKPIRKFEFQYSTNGYLQSVLIIENEIQTGHIINKYNKLNQVIEQEHFTSYDRFAKEDSWSDYINNYIYTFQYDSIGFIQSVSTETYNVGERKWEIEVHEFKCTLQQEDNHYIGNWKIDNQDFLKVEIDNQGNWIRKEELTNGEIKVSLREITYYE